MRNCKILCFHGRLFSWPINGFSWTQFMGPYTHKLLRWVPTHVTPNGTCFVAFHAHTTLLSTMLPSVCTVPSGITGLPWTVLLYEVPCNFIFTVLDRSRPWQSCSGGHPQTVLNFLDSSYTQTHMQATTNSSYFPFPVRSQIVPSQTVPFVASQGHLEHLWCICVWCLPHNISFLESMCPQR